MVPYCMSAKWHISVDIQIARSEPNILYILAYLDIADESHWTLASIPKTMHHILIVLMGYYGIMLEDPISTSSMQSATFTLKLYTS